jgi:MFS family permease
MGAIWAVAIFPPLLFKFFSAHDDADRGDRNMEGHSLYEALRTPAFYKLVVSAAFFALAILGLVVSFVPMLVDEGVTPLLAAGAASLIGVFSIVGRLTTGALLDRFPPYTIGAAAFLLPIAGCGILFLEPLGISRFFAASALFGLALGAETDVIPFVATLRFGLKNIGAIQGALHASIALGSATGPIAASLVFDHFGNYSPFLAGISLSMLLSAALIFSLRDRLS